jgi:lipoate-protein ligase A
LLIDGPLAGAENMARDAALLGSMTPDALPVLRIFLWQKPTVTFGRMQSRELAMSMARAHDAHFSESDWDVAQRPSGGGTVLHKNDVSFSVAWHKGHASFPACIKNNYLAVHQAVADGLASRGVQASLYPTASKNPAPFCFTGPVENDVMLKGKKICGGALRAAGAARLYQGNLLAEDVGMGREEAVQFLRESFERFFFFGPPA